MMKGYRENGGGGARVYDDVFGGPPKFGATTLPPRVEDYTEIFQGFHASRGSSIPVLDLPAAAQHSDDVRIDYSEVFGGFNGLDFAVSYHDLFNTSKTDDEAWTPAQSDESDPLESTEETHVSGSNKIENDNFFSLHTSKDLGEWKRSTNQKPLVSVSDLGLKTQPSYLPPPSRPPPALTSNKGDFKLKTSSMKSEHVESDSSSSAAAAMKDAVTQAQAKLKTAKEFKDRNKEALQTGDKKERLNEVSNVFGGQRMPGNSTATTYEVKEENIRDDKATVEREINITEAGNSIDITTVKKPILYLGVDKTKGTVASREASEPVVRKPVPDARIFEPNAKSTGSIKCNKSVFESFEPIKDGKTLQERDFTENVKRQETLDRSDREEESLNDPTASHKTNEPKETEKMFLVSQQHGDFRTLNDSENELFDNLIEIQLKDNDLKPKEKIVAENWLKNDDGKKEVNMGPAAYIWEDYDDRFEEVSEKEHDKGLKETEDQDEKEFQQSCHPEISIMKSEEEDDHEREEGDRLVEHPFWWEEDERGSLKASEQEECGNIIETVSEQNEKILPVELMQEEEKIKAEVTLEKEVKACARDDNVQTLKHAEANDKNKTIHNLDCNSEENKNLHHEWEREERGKKVETVSASDDIENEGEGTKWDEIESTTEENSEVASDVLFQVDDNEILQASGDLEHCDKNETTTIETPCFVQSHKHNEEAEETVEQIHKAGEESFSSFELNRNDLQGVKVEVIMEDVTYSNSSNESRGKTFGVDVIGQTLMENDKRRTTTSTTTPRQLAKESVESETKPITDQVDSLRNTNRSMERKDEIRNKAVSEKREKEEMLQGVRELENERLRKIEEERERQIEREKDRMAVDRATLEARETRERSERAAVERATAEFRQRALADARERLEKACAEARERSLAEKAMEGRLRVEKATAEARERAVADKFSSYQNTGTRQNSLPSDLAGTYSGLRYSQTATQSEVGGEGESPQRCKARLERHQRTADRAANALAEKNMRDLIAQKEQAERNRLAEGLDAEVKRWSSGKQGNLRALLSTLQYILGSDSGWQAIPLTEVITTPAVKKAYRKATLCVHPDKLQQRGATIQQKYICEKVFDLLKEAWIKFNSEER